jgi:hypothetical protein
MNQPATANRSQYFIEEQNFSCNRFYSVEFSVNGPQLLYQSKLWSRSSDSVFALVKEDSDIINWIRVGDVLDMKYYSEDELCPVKNFNTRIQYISRDDNGRFKGHYRVGLAIVAEESNHCQPDHVQFSATCSTGNGL